jgi:hypothetical protein
LKSVECGEKQLLIVIRIEYCMFVRSCHSTMICLRYDGRSMDLHSDYNLIDGLP